jgi:anti-sigma factor RsiW
MTECRRSFDESLLSGYVDHALGQQDEQRVRLHLERCTACQALVAELEELREVTLSSRFEVPPDDQWDETPRGGASRLFRGVGWLMTLIWFLGLAGFLGVEVWAESASMTERILLFGGALAFALLLLSALVDRWSTYADDRYRRVRR